MLKRVKEIAREAGAVLRTYHGKELDVQYKTDEFDPVTEADYASDRVIHEALHKAFPADQILSEEREASGIDWSGRVWVIDPLDGTKYFVRGIDEFGVTIGLCINGKPNLGVVYFPIQDQLYYAEAGKGAFREDADGVTRIHVTQTAEPSEARYIVRYDLGDTKPFDALVQRILKELGRPHTIKAGSTAKRLMLIAEGSADAFISPSQHTMKWDTCGAEIILTEAGGRITSHDGAPLDYTQPDPSWTRSYIASNGHLQEQILRALQ